MSEKQEDEKEIKRMVMQLLEEDAYVDVSEEIKLPPVALSLGTYDETDLNGVTKSYDLPIGTYGNFSFIQAAAKVGKSLFTSILSTSYIYGQNKYCGKIKGHRKGRKVVHFDTEQSKFHSQKVFRRPLIMGDEKQIDEYYTYCLREMDWKDRVDFIDYILFDKLNSKDIGLVIIDGVIDLLGDPNNLEQSTNVVQKLMTWTGELKCHIVTVIHENPGSSKPTGHLGTFLERKCETQIMLKKNHINEGWITVECKRGRNATFETFSFRVNDRVLPEVVYNDYEF